VTARLPDRPALMVTVMRALADAEPPDVGDIPEARTGLAAINAVTPCVVAGLPVAKEAYARLGVRLRALAADGAVVRAGARVAELGGPVRAILLGEPTVRSFLEDLSAVASGTRRPDRDNPLHRYAAGFVSPSQPVGENWPRFEWETLEQEEPG
jgi:Quinolinate phosphoribosyl transferase, N-terminal domain